MVRPAMLADHEVVKRLSIEEKVEFWRWVMRHAKDRGIDVYVFTWNTFTFGAEAKHGITSDVENPITWAYFRASVRELITTYPLLAGLGITAGEGMPEKMDSREKEEWLWDTYGEGVRDALKSPTAAHRAHDPPFSLDRAGRHPRRWKDYPGFPATFDFSFKYSVAHMYSIPNPPFIQPLLEASGVEAAPTAPEQVITMPTFAANLTMLFTEVPRAIEYAKVLRVPRLNRLARKRLPGCSDEDHWQTLVHNVRFAATELAPHGIELLVEPINHFDIPGFFLARTERALELLDEVAQPNLRLQ
jgi:hypothetical protein